jgi:hypothetical protein
MEQTVRYCVRIGKRGTLGDRFGWSICRQDNSLEVNRSTETFETRVEALVDSVDVALALAFPLSIEFADEDAATNVQRLEGPIGTE